MTYPSGTVVSYPRNTIGELTSIAADSTTLMSVTQRNDAGQVTQATFGNGFTLSQGFIPETLQLETLTYDKAGTKWLDLLYGYNKGTANTGQIRSITEHPNNTSDPRHQRSILSYDYDPLGRLTGAESSGGTTYPKWDLSWSYDQYGNRTDQDDAQSPAVAPEMLGVQYNTATNRITNLSHSYDAAGNVVADSVGTYVFDAMNRIISATTGAGTATYEYDAAGVRTKRDEPGQSAVVEVRAGPMLIAEYASGGNPTSPLEEFYGDWLAVLASDDGSDVSYYLRDHLSVRLETDSLGSTIHESGHFPFGESWYAGSSIVMRFTTYERNGPGGQDYAIARAYGYTMGRFGSADPVARSPYAPALGNRYQYSSNDPVNRWDPLGLEDSKKEPVLCIVGETHDPQGSPCEVWVSIDESHVFEYGADQVEKVRVSGSVPPIIWGTPYGGIYRWAVRAWDDRGNRWEHCKGAAGGAVDVVRDSLTAVAKQTGGIMRAGFAYGGVGSSAPGLLRSGALGTLSSMHTAYGNVWRSERKSGVGSAWTLPQIGIGVASAGATVKAFGAGASVGVFGGAGVVGGSSLVAPVAGAAATGTGFGYLINNCLLGESDRQAIGDTLLSGLNWVRGTFGMEPL